MNVGTAGMVFVNVDADHAFAHGVGAREGNCSTNGESRFSE
jgi:hypothetical protein